MSSIKVLRGQVRQVVQELIGGVVTGELVAAVQKGLTDAQNAFKESQEKNLNDRLDRIENECRESLKKQDQRARAVQGFIVQSSTQELNNFISNTHVTMLAWQEVMAEKNGAIEGLNAEIDKRKASISARLQAEAEAKMAEAIKPEENKASA